MFSLFLSLNIGVHGNSKLPFDVIIYPCETQECSCGLENVAIPRCDWGDSKMQMYNTFKMVHNLIA